MSRMRHSCKEARTAPNQRWKKNPTNCEVQNKLRKRCVKIILGELDCSGGAAGAGVFDEGGEVAAGAVGLDEFLVDAEVGEGEGFFGADEVAEGAEAGELVGGGGLEVEVAEGDDADVVDGPEDAAVFGGADVLAFVDEGAELPDAAGAVDGEVVGDVDHAALEVGFADELEVADGVGGGGGEEGFAVAGMVDGEAGDAVHGGGQLGMAAGNWSSAAGEDVAVGGFCGGAGGGRGRILGVRMVGLGPSPSRLDS